MKDKVIGSVKKIVDRLDSAIYGTIVYSTWYCCGIRLKLWYLVNFKRLRQKDDEYIELACSTKLLKIMLHNRFSKAVLRSSDYEYCRYRDERFKEMARLFRMYYEYRIQF